MISEYIITGLIAITPPIVFDVVFALLFARWLSQLVFFAVGFPLAATIVAFSCHLAEKFWKRDLYHD